MQQSVLFIHGMCVNNEYWKPWTEYFERNGFACFAPSWPQHDKTVNELRARHPDKNLGKLTLKQVLHFYENYAAQMDLPPVMIGHSMGGLIVQLLLNKGYGCGAAAIHSAPPRGVISFKWSFLKSIMPMLSLLNSDKPFLMSFKQFQHSNVNTLPLNQQRELYDRYVVPESPKIPVGSLTGRIDFKKPHPPLLLTAGGMDRIIPASLNKSNFRKYKGDSKTKYAEFNDHTHFIIAQQNWKVEAEYILSWIKAEITSKKNAREEI